MCLTPSPGRMSFVYPSMQMQADSGPRFLGRPLTHSMTGKHSKEFPCQIPEDGLRQLRARGPGHVLVAQPSSPGEWAVYVAASEMVANDARVLAAYSDAAGDGDE